MTPAARWAAAAEIMDQITAGEPAEKALTNWARRSRFAGSKDRAAVRDHVFDILRCWRSTAFLGGGNDGRQLVLGRLKQIDIDPDTIFTGEGYAMPPLTPEDSGVEVLPEGADALDLPDWVYDIVLNDLDVDFQSYSEALRVRAPVFLRVNTLKSNLSTAQQALADAGIATAPHPLSDTALEVLENPRRVAQSTAYLSGDIELQDAASQAVVDALPLQSGMRILDYCAGGGGKTLAMAARVSGPVDAHDSDANRMSDLPLRAERAGAVVNVKVAPRGPYDLVLCDVPCSGSGSWRRAPEGKWRLTPAKLETLEQTQKTILDDVTDLVAPNGVLAYVTCSVFSSENENQIDSFLERHPGWTRSKQTRFGLDQGGDGFFVATLTRE